jgi:hypothetical protein
MCETVGAFGRSEVLLTLDGKECRLITRLISGRCTLRRHLHITGLTIESVCRKRGQRQESFYHTLFRCSALAGHSTQRFVSAWLEATDLNRVLPRKVLARALRIGLC